MFATILIFIILFHNKFFLSSAIIIGKLSYQIYIPSPPIMNPPLIFYYLNSCEECLCYGIRSTTSTFVAVNCLVDTRICLLYSSYETNYSFQWNSTNYLYFFVLPSHTPSQMTTSGISTVSITSKS